MVIVWEGILGDQLLGPVVLRNKLNRCNVPPFFVNEFACGSVWLWNLVSDIKGGTQTEGV
jgi:hypothetical protein